MLRSRNVTQPGLRRRHGDRADDGREGVGRGAKTEKFALRPVRRGTKILKFLFGNFLHVLLLPASVFWKNLRLLCTESDFLLFLQLLSGHSEMSKESKQNMAITSTTWQVVTIEHVDSLSCSELFCLFQAQVVQTFGSTNVVPEPQSESIMIPLKRIPNGLRPFFCLALHFRFAYFFCSGCGGI